MSEDIHVSTKDASVARLLARVPYNGQRAMIRSVEPGEFTLSHTYWDSGSRFSYYLVKLDDGETRAIPHVNPPAFGGPERQVVNMTDGIALVELHSWRGTSCTLYVCSTNMAALLPPPSDVSRDELIVLAATVALKSSYNGQSNYRFREARSYTGITSERWEAAKASLIDKRLLNKAGAITVDGRNAVGSTRLYNIGKEN